MRPIIEVIEQDYEIPQLGVKRKISALLPADYHDTDKVYPVLYLQDGQNLFNPHAPFGDWGIDHSLTGLAEQGMTDIIIIAIDHGEEERIYEYSPYYNPLFGEGKGKQYVSFLTDTLVPYINEHFRVSTRRHDTGIGGSSMGGLISLYAGGMESKQHIPNIKRLDEIMAPKFNDLTFARYKCSIYEQGQHGEFYWAHEFPKAIKWLYFTD